MSEFFKGWRRKTGCVALVMACVLMGMWVRSRYLVDELSALMPLDVNNYTLMSYSDCIHMTVWKQAGLTPVEGWRWKSERLDAPRSVTIIDSWAVELLEDGLLWQIPYWFLVMPLTLLSAYLILWKPRPKERRNA
jgi:hypothetical protein